MTKKRSRIIRYTGRVEFQANLDEILDLYMQGYSRSHIHMELTRREKMSMSYSSFLKYMQRFINETSLQDQDELIKAQIERKQAPSPDSDQSTSSVHVHRRSFDYNPSAHRDDEVI